MKFRQVTHEQVCKEVAPAMVEWLEKVGEFHIRQTWQWATKDMKREIWRMASERLKAGIRRLADENAG